MFPNRKTGSEAAEAAVTQMFLVDLRVDNPDAALQAALKRPLPSATSQDLGFDHQVL